MKLFLILFGVAAAGGFCVLVVAIFTWTGASLERRRIRRRLESYRTENTASLSPPQRREKALEAVGGITIASLAAEPELTREVIALLKDTAADLEPPAPPTRVGTSKVRIKDGGGSPVGGPAEAEDVVKDVALTGAGESPVPLKRIRVVDLGEARATMVKAGLGVPVASAEQAEAASSEPVASAEPERAEAEPAAAVASAEPELAESAPAASATSVEWEWPEAGFAEPVAEAELVEAEPAAAVAGTEPEWAEAAPATPATSVEWEWPEAGLAESVAEAEPELVEAEPAAAVAGAEPEWAEAAPAASAGETAEEAGEEDAAVAG